MALLNRKRSSSRTEGKKLRRLRTRYGVLALAFGLTGAGLAAPPLKTNSTTSVRTARPWYQIGKASWYGGHFNGRKTATGERFDMNGLTCAHRNLPLGSWVKVTNLTNGREAYLRVNDRGPMSEGLIVDLSYGAAQKLGVTGISKVRLDRVTQQDAQLAEIQTAKLEIPVIPVRAGR